MNKFRVIVAGAAGLALCVGAGNALASAPSNGVTLATLRNGLRVVIVHDDLAPVVTTEMNYLVGADEVAKGFPGTAHAVEHMMFRGSPGLARGQLLAIASDTGGHFNRNGVRFAYGRLNCAAEVNLTPFPPSGRSPRPFSNSISRA